MAIRNFRCKETQALFNRQPSRRWRELEQVARRKLEQLHAAASLDFLRVPPGNRLEALRGDRKGQHAIRINDQWRLCFRWIGSDAEDVEIADYH
ncbi:MAG TPA: type II toxin-antitoxin system RelE/ParE family toxin [Xanthomonadaceae bacterium]|nr:type II toxin-antitoxin system RelE/ParE family toxin [Xanthomonadaceae bacterium]